MKSLYYQFTNFIQTMSPLWFITIVMLLIVSVLVLVMQFFKVYNGTQKKFEKLSKIVLAILLLALLIYITSIR